MAAGPAQFPHSLDNSAERILLVETDEASLSSASFLDQRLLTPQTRAGWAPLSDLLACIGPDVRDDAHYIFHIGHVGSTLLSRLLGALPDVLALREPLILRTLANIHERRDAVDAPWNPDALADRTIRLRRLLARTFTPSQRAIVKATSFTSEIAPHLVAPQARAVFLTVSPDSYMRTILAGENSRMELTLLTGPRLVRLAQRMEAMPFRAWSLDEGERVALGWVTEMLSLSAAADAMPAGSVLWIDFDAFLAAPSAELLRIARHFGLPTSEQQAAQLAAGPLMQRYSKGPEHGYSTDLRRQLQVQAGHEHAATLARAHRWLATYAKAEPRVARLLG